MKKFVVIAIVVGALVFGALNFHFILLDNNFKILKKTNMNLEYTFVDARGAKKLKLVTNPALLSAGIREYIE